MQSYAKRTNFSTTGPFGKASIHLPSDYQCNCPQWKKTKCWQIFRDQDRPQSQWRCPYWGKTRCCNCNKEGHLVPLDPACNFTGSNLSRYCSYCGKRWHTTTDSKHCYFYYPEGDKNQTSSDISAPHSNSRPPDANVHISATDQTNPNGFFYTKLPFEEYLRIEKSIVPPSVTACQVRAFEIRTDLSTRICNDIIKEAADFRALYHVVCIEDNLELPRINGLYMMTSYRVVRNENYKPRGKYATEKMELYNQMRKVYQERFKGLGYRMTYAGELSGSNEARGESSSALSKCFVSRDSSKSATNEPITVAKTTIREMLKYEAIRDANNMKIKIERSFEKYVLSRIMELLHQEDQQQNVQTAEQLPGIRSEQQLPVVRKLSYYRQRAIRLLQLLKAGTLKVRPDSSLQAFVDLFEDTYDDYRKMLLWNYKYIKAEEEKRKSTKRAFNERVIEERKHREELTQMKANFDMKAAKRRARGKQATVDDVREATALENSLHREYKDAEATISVASGMSAGHEHVIQRNRVNPVTACAEITENDRPIPVEDSPMETMDSKAAILNNDTSPATVDELSREEVDCVSPDHHSSVVKRPGKNKTKLKRFLERKLQELTNRTESPFSGHFDSTSQSDLLANSTPIGLSVPDSVAITDSRNPRRIQEIQSNAKQRRREQFRSEKDKHTLERKQLERKSTHLGGNCPTQELNHLPQSSQASGATSIRPVRIYSPIERYQMERALRAQSLAANTSPLQPSEPFLREQVAVSKDDNEAKEVKLARSNQRKAKHAMQQKKTSDKIPAGRRRRRRNKTCARLAAESLAKNPHQHRKRGCKTRPVRKSKRS